MKKLLFKVVVLVAVMLAVPYYLLGGGSLPDFMKGISQEAPNKPMNISNAVTDKDVTVYKWVDDQGRTHFSSTPPTGQETETMQLRADANVVQAVKTPDKEEEEAAAGSVLSLGKAASDGEGLPNPYSPEGVKQLIEDAKNVQELLNKRYQQQGQEGQ